MTTAVTLPGTSSLTMAGPQGRAYRVMFGDPLGPAADTGYPVVCVLDGDRLFASTLDAIRLRCGRPDATGIGPAVVVGVACTATGDDARQVRRLDFTPEEGAAWPRATDGDEAASDAAAFRQFLIDAVLPAVVARYAVDSAQVVLVGHSLAGLAVLAALAAGMRAFTGYLAISPSLWTAPAFVEAIPSMLQRVDRQPARVVVTVGEYEQRRAPWQPAGAMTDDALERRDVRRMVDRVRALGEALREVPGLGVDVHECAGEDHASVILPSLARGLRLVLPPACDVLLPVSPMPTASGVATA